MPSTKPANRTLQALNEAAYAIDKTVSTFAPERGWDAGPNQWSGIDLRHPDGWVARTAAEFTDDPDETADIHLFDERELHVSKISFQGGTPANIVALAARAILGGWMDR